MACIMGIDPGRDKCGVAVLTRDGEIKFQKVIATSDFDATLEKISAEFGIELVILGDGTTHRAIEKKILAADLPIKVVDEKFTTEQARKLYWQKKPPQGWRKFLPTSLQVPPEPVDDIVAEILVKRHLS